MIKKIRTNQNMNNRRQNKQHNILQLIKIPIQQGDSLLDLVHLHNIRDANMLCRLLKIARLMLDQKGNLQMRHQHCFQCSKHFDQKCIGQM